jgi:NAD(P)-dependent dehydrogenase (short-subunit alcohol dehydrogenase family)
MNPKPVALVTGGRRGIGKGIAVELARSGFDLAASYVGSRAEFLSGEAASQFAQEEVEACGAAFLSIQADVSEAADRRRMIETVEKRYGRCDLLVNNAGVAPLNRVDLLEATEESFERVLKINLQGPYFLTQQVARWMIQQQSQHPHRRCRIVNIGSISAFTSSPIRGEYCVSKAGLGMMTALFADRLAEYGIGVFEIRPGIIATDMTAPVKEKYDKMIADGLLPMRRWGLPQDVALAVAAIAQGKLDYCTGQVINADGGFHLRRL